MKVNTTRRIKRTVQGIAVSLVMVPVVSNAQAIDMTDIQAMVANVHAARFEQLCSNSDVVLSERATEACAEGTQPTIVGDGSRWSDRGIGSEFNTLWRNFGAVEVAEVETNETE